MEHWWGLRDAAIMNFKSVEKFKEEMKEEGYIDNTEGSKT